MIRHALRLFARYSERHFELTLRGGPLPGPPGYLDTLCVARGRVSLRGWSQAERVRMRLGGAEAVERPAIARADVAAARGIAPEVGFEISLPAAPGPLELELEHEGARHTARLRLPGGWRLWRARARLWGRFLAAVLPLVPMVLRGLARRDPQLRHRVRDALHLGPASGLGVLESGLLAVDEKEDGAAEPARGGVSIVLPVYNALELLREALARVVRHTDLPWRLVLIEDCSSDPQVRPFLRDWVEQARAGGAEVVLIENPENLGFIGSVNAGLERALALSDDPVVLLNSDALVPAGWASRLLAPLHADARVASVTPMSNDAEIFSVPAICRARALAPGQGDAIDALAARLRAPAAAVEVPTGVGFCMAMSRAYLERVPRLDPAFGRGYGEEVDWCRKTAALGGRHLAQPRLFVEHRGGESFGSAEKLRLIARNNALIARRYGDYDAKVQQFIQDDPLLSARLLLALGWLDSGAEAGGEVPVYLAHSMGGGADMYLAARLARARRAGGGGALVLRLGGPRRVQVELHVPAEAPGGAEGPGDARAPQGPILAGLSDDMEFVLALVRLLRRRRVIYSCAVGDRDPLGLPDWMLALAEGAALEVLFHDYLPLSPSYTLLDSDGVYRAPPRPAVAGEDPAHQARRPDGRRVSLQDWQAAWGRALAGAERVVVFSDASRALVAEVYPQAAARIVTEPHALLHHPGKLDAPPPGARVVLGVLGNIGPQKGAAVVAALSRRLRGRADAALVLLGALDPAYALAPGTTHHARYDPDQIAALAARHGITHWLIPSIWPETFSYTTHEALETGLPVLAFDLGAQGAAVAAATGQGRVIALPRRATPPEALADLVLAALGLETGANGGAGGGANGEGKAAPPS